jgi:hypothetical protein
MQKVLHLDAPTEHYQSDGAVVWCYDQRFELTLRKFIKRRGLEHPDHIRVAGGAKCLATPEPELERQFVLDQVRKSIRLHATRRVLLMVHADCGAYGGKLAFANPEDERRHHLGELERAAACLTDNLPGIAVECYFADFDGVWAA